MAQPLSYAQMMADPELAKQLLEDQGVDVSNLDPDFLANPDLTQQESVQQTIAETPVQPKITPEETAPPSIYDLLHKSMGEQQSYIDSLKSRLEKEQNKSSLSGLDIRPFAQALKGYGSTTVAVPETAPVSKEAMIQALQDKIKEASQGLTKEQVDYLKAKAFGEKQGSMQDLAKQRLDLAKQRLEQSKEQRAITRVGNDKILNDYGNRINAITRSNILLDKAKQITTASVDEYQQNLRSALTNIKGTGGVTERAQIMLHTIDMTLAKLKQQFGDLDSIPKNHPLLVHLRDLSNHAKEELQSQYDARLEAAKQTSLEKAVPAYKEAIQPKSSAAQMSFEEFKKRKAEGSL